MSESSRAAGGHKNLKQAGKLTIAIIVFCIYLFPFALVLVNSLKTKVSIVKAPLMLADPKGPQWINYQNAIEKMNFPRTFGNSLFVVGVSVILLLIVSSMAAWLFVRTDWKACKISFSAMLASMIVPFQDRKSVV